MDNTANSEDLSLIHNGSIKYFSADEYNTLLESIDVDYFIVQKSTLYMYHALERDDSFEYVMETKNFAMYKKLIAD